MTLEEKVKEAFNVHRKLDVLFATSDGKLFSNSEVAGPHAATLKDKKVTPFNRKTIEADERLKEDAAKINNGDDTPPADEPGDDIPPADEPGDDIPPSDEPGDDTPPADESGDDTPPSDELVKPTDKSHTKEQLADWLNEQDVEFDLKDTKPVLLDKAVAKYNELTKTE